MGYAFFFRVCCALNKAAGVFFLFASANGQKINEFFRGKKTDAKKNSKLNFAQRLSRNLNIVFSLHFGYLLCFLERALFANRISHAQKNRASKNFLRKIRLGETFGLALRKPLACYRVLVYPKLAPRLQKNSCQLF